MSLLLAVGSTGNVSDTIDVAGSITLAGQSLSVAINVPLTHGAITVSGQSLSTGFGTQLAAGSITVSGQSLTIATNVPLSGGAVTLAGQSLSTGFDVALLGGGITVSGQTLSSDVGASNVNDSLDAGAITISGQDLLSAVTESRQYSGGFFAAIAIERARSLRRRLEKEREDEEREQIADDVAREIARLFAAQQETENKQAEIDRILALAAEYRQEIEANERLDRSLRQLLTKQSEGAWLSLIRELERANEEEEFLIMAAVLLAS